MKDSLAQLKEVRANNVYAAAQRLFRREQERRLFGDRSRDPAYGILWPRIADLPMMHPHPPVDPVLAWGRG